jgi:DNA-binding NtrC family response regulator
VPVRTRSASEADGVLYVDFRRVDARVDGWMIEFLESLAGLLGALAAHHVRLSRAQEQLRDARTMEAPADPTLDELLTPPSMAPIRRELASALDGVASIFVLGESGTGKTLLAHAIAGSSRRRPIVRAMLGSSDDLNTVTSELFGHERGAYSGAVGKRVGLVELAHQGTLILDEVLNLSPNAQKLLLDFTQFRTYRPLGWDRPEPKRADVRIVAATNGDLEAAMREGRFREDLYHRLAMVTLHMPPLRERRAEIPVLAESFLRRLEPEIPWMLGLDLRRRLVSPDLAWSGNVRQLERVILRARDRARAADPGGTTIALAHADLGEGVAVARASTSTRGDALERSNADRWRAVQRERALLETTERDVLARLVAEHGGVVSKVARALDVPRSTLVSRMDALGLDPRRVGRDGA